MTSSKLHSPDRFNSTMYVATAREADECSRLVSRNKQDEAWPKLLDVVSKFQTLKQQTPIGRIEKLQSGQISAYINRSRSMLENIQNVVATALAEHFGQLMLISARTEDQQAVKNALVKLGVPEKVREDIRELAIKISRQPKEDRPTLLSNTYLEMTASQLANNFITEPVTQSLVRTELASRVLVVPPASIPAPVTKAPEVFPQTVRPATAPTATLETVTPVVIKVPQAPKHRPVYTPAPPLSTSIVLPDTTNLSHLSASQRLVEQFSSYMGVDEQQVEAFKMLIAYTGEISEDKTGDFSEFLDKVDQATQGAIYGRQFDGLHHSAAASILFNYLATVYNDPELRIFDVLSDDAYDNRFGNIDINEGDIADCTGTANVSRSRLAQRLHVVDSDARSMFRRISLLSECIRHDETAPLNSKLAIYLIRRNHNWSGIQAMLVKHERPPLSFEDHTELQRILLVKYGSLKNIVSCFLKDHLAKDLIGPVWRPFINLDKRDRGLINIEALLCEADPELSRRIYAESTHLNLMAWPRFHRYA